VGKGLFPALQSGIMLRIHSRVLLLIVAAAAGTLTGFAQAPGGMPRPSPPPTTRDASRNPDTADTPSSSEAAARGQVVLANGSMPEGLVQIFVVGGGAEKFIAVADSKGRFSFNPGVLSTTGCTRDCVLRAALEGYRSETKPLAGVNPNGSSKLGKILLQPLSSDTNGLVSVTSGQASKGAKKAYEKGLDEAAKQSWAEAKASLLKATSAYRDYSDAWLTLGILQQSEGDRDGAQKSYAESARADGKFAAPLILIAGLLNALGNLNLKKVDAVEKSATEGLKIDTEHRYLELDYMLGVALSAKHDVDGATKHLQTYIQQSPDGPNAARAKSVLEELRASH
jgi:hypothetical protein